jgi:hypothetical protein
MFRICIIGWLFLFADLSLFAQVGATYPLRIDKPLFYVKTLPLREMPNLTPVTPTTPESQKPEILDEPFPLSELNAGGFAGTSLQQTMGNLTPAGISVNAEGIANLQNKIPPDTEGDVGPDQYVQMINMLFAVFDKNGNLIYGPVDNITLWQNAPGPWSGHSNGDPIVLYDEQADRWLISELSFPNHPYGPYYEKIAISETSDPTGAWYLYGFDYEYFCDYPKIGIWNDGYYLTTNNNFWVNDQWDFHAVGVTVFERDSMLAGSPNARRIFFDMYPNTEPWSILPADIDGNPPPDGTPAWLAHYKEGTPDRIRIYAVFTDWTEPDNSYITLSATLLPEAFTGSLPNGIPQPGGAPYLAALSNRLMYRLQYRNFGDYQTLVTNHTVNVGNEVAGLRWYEFRNPGPGWEIMQQGTFAPDNTCRWMGSMAMDEYGNMALGYSVSGYDTYPSIRFTGRYCNDPPGLMTIAEQTVINGSGVQLSPYHRWGDYSAMSLDPADQITFWYTQQYYETTGDRSWQTRIAAFRLIDPLSLQISAQPDSLCRGDSTYLNAIPSGGSGIYTFNWTSDPPGIISTEQNPTIAPDTTIVLNCTINDGVNQSDASVLISVIPDPQAWAGPDTLICSDDNFNNQVAIASDYSSLEWSTSGDGYFDDTSCLHPIYYPGSEDIENGWVSLRLQVFSAFPCDTASDLMELVIDPCTGIKGHRSLIPFATVSPNPNGGSFGIVLSNFPESLIRLKIRDIAGQIIREKEIRNMEGAKVKRLQFDSFKPGIYIVEIMIPDQQLVLKILVL